MKTLHFKIYVNDEFDEERALVEVTDNQFKVVQYGDYYHDKIDERIEGFLEGLIYIGDVQYELEDDCVYINHKDEQFGLIGFTQEEYDENEE